MDDHVRVLCMKYECYKGSKKTSRRVSWQNVNHVEQCKAQKHSPLDPDDFRIHYNDVINDNAPLNTNQYSIVSTVNLQYKKHCETTQL